MQILKIVQKVSSDKISKLTEIVSKIKTSHVFGGNTWD